MKNRMTDLRNHLFETLEALKDADAPMELERAKTISRVAQTIIESAKVEVDLVKAIGGDALVAGGFFGEPGGAEPRPPLQLAKGTGPRAMPAGSKS